MRQSTHTHTAWIRGVAKVDNAAPNVNFTHFDAHSTSYPRARQDVQIPAFSCHHRLSMMLSIGVSFDKFKETLVRDTAKCLT